MLCNGEACNYSSLLNAEGKLGNNWVRRSSSLVRFRGQGSSATTGCAVVVAWLGLGSGSSAATWCAIARSWLGLVVRQARQQLVSLSLVSASVDILGKRARLTPSPHA